MIKKFIKTNINIFSLILLLLGKTFLPYLWIFGAFIYIFILIPAVFIIAIVDAIINKESCATNLIFLLISVYLVENISVRQDMTLYFSWLIFLLILLFAFNYIKKDKIFKYSTILVLCFSILFRLFIQIPGNTNFNKNIMNKVGYHGKVCSSNQTNCKEYKIPRQYEELKFIIGGDFCPVFRAIKKGKVLFIDHTNKNIFPNAQEVEYLGYGNSQGYLFFKVKENNKFGFYSYDAKNCQKHGYSTENNALTTLIQPIYDEMTIIKEENPFGNYVSQDTYKAPNNNGKIVAVVGRKGNSYDLYKQSRKKINRHKRNQRDEIEYKPYLQNKRSIIFIRNIPKNMETNFPAEYQFEIDGRIKNFNFSDTVKFGTYTCRRNGYICSYKFYEGGFSYSSHKGQPCDLDGYRNEYLMSEKCTFRPSNVKKYECMYNSNPITIYMENGRVTSAQGNNLPRIDMQNYYNLSQCKQVPMKYYR